jgi:hypothetical protein
VSRPRDCRGFVALEWVAAVALLLLPVVVVVATLPGWAERGHVATVAAREAARALARDWPNGNAAAAELVARSIASDHGVDDRDVDVRVVAAGESRGSVVRVDVRIRMPAIDVPGASRVAGWTYTATSTRRIEDYRSR